MKETMKKFGTWLLAAVLAFAGTGAAQAADYTAANQEEFLTVAANAVSGDRILLGEGKFAIGPVDINGKTLTFKGVSEAKTTVYIGAGGYDGNGGHGSNKTANMTFENLTLDDLASDQGYLTGFTEAAGLTFRKVTFNVGFSNWGNKGGAVSFYDCTFNQTNTEKYNVQELRSASGTQYLFEGCVFNSAGGRFINAYKQGGATSNIGIVIKNCTFKNTGDAAGKCALNLKDSSNGCTIALTFVGENKVEGAFPSLNESTKPSKLFATEGAGNATVMLKATDEDNPVVIYANNTKIEGEWIDPDGYKPASSAVAKIGTAEYETLEAAIAAAAAGDTVEIVKADTYSFPSLPNNITLSCSDGVIFNCEGSDSISLVPNGCTVIGGTFNMGQNNYHGWQHAGAMAFENSTFNGKFFGYANLTFTGCHFVQTAEDYCMWTYSSPRIDYINCTFDCKGKAVNVYWEQHEGPTEVTADGCMFNSSKENKPALKINSLYGAFVVATTSNNTLSGFPRGISGYDNEPGEGDNAYIVTNAEFDEAGKLISGEANRAFPEAIAGQYFAADLATVSNTEGETWKIGVKTEDETIITTKPQESKVEVPQEVVKDAEVVEKIEQSTKVEGVKLSAAATEQKPAGIVAVVEEAKKNTEFAAAVAAAAEVSVKVEVEVKPTEYDNTADKGKVAFKLTPKATVTVVQEETKLEQVVEVTNDMIDQNQKIAVSIYTGFAPVAITHDDDNGARIEIFEGDQIAYNEVTGVATVLISHFSTLTGFGDAADVPPAKAPAVAKIGETPYETLQAAVNAVKEGETIELLAGTIEEGEITLPNTIKNVTIKGAADHASILKNTTLAHRTGDKSFDGLTIDGVVFDNGRFMLIDWGAGSIKNLTFTNNIFRNLGDTTNEAAVHLNVNAAGAVSGFTFENNVIDGCTGGQKSGIYGAVKGDTTIRNNTFNNIAFRPICVQIIDTDGVDDNTVVTGNAFSGSSVGRLQIYGTENETTCAPEGTDGGSFIVNNNIFKDITSQQICCWGINTEKVTTDITSNYYDAEDPKMFWNDFNNADSFYISNTDIAANLPHANHDNFNYYTDLTEDGKIDPDTLVEVKKAAVAQIVETGKGYPTLQAAVAEAGAGQTVKLLTDVTLDGKISIAGKSIVITSNGEDQYVIDATGIRAFEIAAGAGLTLSNVAVKNAVCDNGGAISTSGALVLDGCLFENNTSSGYGAAIAVQAGSGGTVAATDTVFRCNSMTSGAYGATVHVTNGGSARTSTFLRCTFEGNDVNGCCASCICVNAATATITDCRFVGNDGQAVIYLDNAASLGEKVSGCIFDGNDVTHGALFIASGCSCGAVTDCVFVNNRARQRGAGVYASGAIPTVANCVFAGNTDYANDPTTEGYVGSAVFGIVANVTNNVFVGNKSLKKVAEADVIRTDEKAKNVCVWPDEVADFSANYWDGGMDVSAYDTDKADYACDVIYTQCNVTYEGGVLKIDGEDPSVGKQNIVLSGAVSFVAEIFVGGESKGKYETVGAALRAAANFPGTAENPTIVQLASGIVSDKNFSVSDFSLTYVTVQGSGDHATEIKNTSIQADGGKSVLWKGVTFKNIVFDNSHFRFTTFGLEDLTFDGNVFRNLDYGNTEAGVHFNLDAERYCKNLTYVNNLFDTSKTTQLAAVNSQSGLTGNIVITNNVFKNSNWRSLQLQIRTNDGVEDNLLITDNWFNGNASAMQITKSEAHNDAVSVTFNYNAVDDGANISQIIIYNFDLERLTLDLGYNYYLVSPDENPGKFYLGGTTTCTKDNIGPVYPYYANYDKDALEAGTKTVREALYNLVELVEPSEEIDVPVADSGEAVIPVKVPAGIFEQKQGQEIKGSDGQPLPAPTTTEQKQQFLVTEQPNGLKVWQNVAMGVDGNTAVNALATISREPTVEEKAEAAKTGKTVDIVINTPISEFDPPTTTGVTVSYKLLRSVNGGVTWTEVATNLEKPEFPTWTQDNSQDALISEGDTFWKFQAVFTSQANEQAE